MEEEQKQPDNNNTNLNEQDEKIKDDQKSVSEECMSEKETKIVQEVYKKENVEDSQKIDENNAMAGSENDWDTVNTGMDQEKEEL